MSQSVRGRRHAAAAHSGRRRFWSVWVTVFLGFLVVGTVWSLAQPPFSGIDELQHFNEAEAVWSGQFIPPLTPDGAQFESGLIHVKYPPFGAGCFIAKIAVPASCDRITFRQPARQQTAIDYVSREPPLPALLTGLPSYLAPDRVGFYLSRALDTLIGAAGIATAVSLALSRRRPLLLVGVILAVTPSVVAGLGALGTSQLEIAAASVLWVAVALLIDGEPPRRRLALLTGVAAVVLVLSRPISFVYLGLAVVALLIATDRARLLALARNRTLQITAVCAAVATLFMVGWYVLVSAPPNPHWLQILGVSNVSGLSQRISIPLGDTQKYWLEAVGLVGYDYTGLWWMTLAWTALAATAVGVALLFVRQTRRLVAVAFLVAILLILPVIAQAITLPSTYLYWEGRYDIPTLAGILILATSTLDGRLCELPELRRLVTTVFVAAPVLGAILLIGALRRYTVGVNGTLNPFAWGSGWRPPLPVVGLIVFGLVALAATYGRIYLFGRPLLSPSAERDNRAATDLEGETRAPVAPRALKGQERSAGSRSGMVSDRVHDGEGLAGV